MDQKIFVVSLGGSLIVPEKIDFKFLKNFKNLINSEIEKGKKFIIIVGGGKTARDYQNTAKKLVKISNDDLDWLGIHSTRLNAHLLLAIFRDNAYYRIIKNPKERVRFKEKILIAAGWKPGFSTDYDSVLLAKTYNSSVIVNLTNVDYVYDKDPKIYKSAKAFPKITWQDYLKLINQKWSPGMSSPFDPLASKLAKKFNLKVIIINGGKLREFKNFLNNEKFKGSVIF